MKISFSVCIFLSSETFYGEWYRRERNWSWSIVSLVRKAWDILYAVICRIVDAWHVVLLSILHLCIHWSTRSNISLDTEKSCPPLFISNLEEFLYYALPLQIYYEVCHIFFFLFLFYFFIMCLSLINLQVHPYIAFEKQWGTNSKIIRIIFFMKLFTVYLFVCA